MKTRQTKHFAKWQAGVTDLVARRAIAIRIARLEAGLFGDAKFFDGIGELRIDVGQGYRLYFVRRGADLVILLIGGDKSTQRKDVEKAKALAAGLD